MELPSTDVSRENENPLRIEVESGRLSSHRAFP
jgi:hypothetical protein